MSEHYIFKVRKRNVDAAYGILNILTEYAIPYSEVQETFKLVEKVLEQSVAMPNKELLARYEDRIKDGLSTDRWDPNGDSRYRELQSKDQSP